MVGWMVGLDGESQFREEKKKKKKKRKTNPNLLSLPSTPSLVFNTVARHFTNPVKPTPAAVRVVTVPAGIQHRPSSSTRIKSDANFWLVLRRCLEESVNRLFLYCNPAISIKYLLLVFFFLFLPSTIWTFWTKTKSEKRPITNVDKRISTVYFAM